MRVNEWPVPSDALATSEPITMQKSYDYVVIGAGSAGCAVAGRLSEDSECQVAVIEAGPPSTGRLFEIPALFSRQLKSFYDWDFETDPEPQLDGRRKYLPRGRVVGGTSAMNTMLYVRGNRADYDGWAQLGATGWSYRRCASVLHRLRGQRARRRRVSRRRRPTGSQRFTIGSSTAQRVASRRRAGRTSRHP